MTTSYTNQTLPIPGDHRYIQVTFDDHVSRKLLLILVRVIRRASEHAWEVVPVAGDNTCLVVGEDHLLRQVNAEPHR